MNKKKKISFDKNKLKFITPIILIIFLFIYSFGLRNGSTDLEGLDDNIKNNLKNNYKNQISQEIKSKYPNLPNTYLENEVQKEINKFEISLNNNEDYITPNGLKISQITIDSISKEQIINIKEKFKADNGQTYLSAIDPYYFLNYAKNYVKNGYVGTTLDENGKPLFDTRLAPEGLEGKESPSFHTLIFATLFNFFDVNYDSDIGEQIKVIYLVSTIVALLSIIPAFLIIRKFSNDICAFFSVLFLMSVPTFVSRTIAGFSDTDGYVVFFPVLIFAFLVYSLFEKNIKISIPLSIISGFFMAVYLLAWGSGIVHFFIFLFSILGYIFYKISIGILDHKNIKKLLEKSKIFLISSFVFLLSSIIFDFIINKSFIFSKAYNFISGSVSSLGAINVGNIWPNVESSIAELNKLSFDGLINSIGNKISFFDNSYLLMGGIILFLSLMGIIFLILDFKNKDLKFFNFELKKKFVKNIKIGLYFFSFIWFYSNIPMVITSQSSNSSILYVLFQNLSNNYQFIFLIVLFLPIILSFIFSLLMKNISKKIYFGILLIIWMAATIYMSLNGIRFILLLATPVALCLGMFLFYLYKNILKFLKYLDVKNKNTINFFPYIILIIFSFSIVYNSSPYSQTSQISKQSLPNFDDTWFELTEKIENTSEKDAIITSWWDFGHFYTTTSNRGVTFDGASQGTPQAHWVGKLLLEEPKQSLEILRMLQCGGNSAFNNLLNITNDNSNGVKLIYEILYPSFLVNTSQEKKNILKNYKHFDFSENQINKIVNEDLFCKKPKQTYLILSEDMVGKSGVWAHWGSWNFYKKYVKDNYQNKNIEEISNNLNLNKTIVENYIEELKNIKINSEIKNQKEEDLINRWFSPYPSYVGQLNSNCEFVNISINCENGIIYNLTSKKILNSNPEIKFSNVFFLDNNGFIEEKQDNFEEEDSLELLFINNGQSSFSLIGSQYPLTKSLFTTTFYLNGFGLNNETFETFDLNRVDVRGQKINTFRINWKE